MDYSIAYLPEAINDIDATLAYLSRFYPSTATSFYRTLEHRIGQLAAHPYMAERWEHDHAFRKLVVDDYLVFYMVYDDTNTVEIHRLTGILEYPADLIAPPLLRKIPPPLPGRGICLLACGGRTLSPANPFLTAHIGAQGCGDFDGAVIT
jgi:plasmid stabilization system protein ParE